MKSKPEPVRPDLEAALHQAFPKNQVVAQPEFDDSYLAKSYDKLRHRLSQIKGADLLYERESEGLEESPYIAQPTQWDDEDDLIPQGPGGVPDYSSYHLFFLGLKDPRFTYECTLDDEDDAETEEDDEAEAENDDGESEDFEDDFAAEDEPGTDAEDDEDDEDEDMGHAAAEPPTTGQGWVGCLVAVSLIAPVALVKFDGFEAFENGDYSPPELEDPTPVDGRAPRGLEEDLRATMGEEAVQALHTLREQILSVLQSCQIEPLPPSEGQKQVPWLAQGQADNVAPEGKVTVQSALFFESY